MIIDIEDPMRWSVESFKCESRVSDEDIKQAFKRAYKKWKAAKFKDLKANNSRWKVFRDNELKEIGLEEWKADRYVKVNIRDLRD